MLGRAIIVVACVAASGLGAGSAAAQNIHTVNAPGPGAAVPWTTAVTNLQTALSAAQPGDEVWIAQGTYTPGSSAGYAIPSGVRVYGGFAGTETNRGQRSPDPSANATVLQGTAGVFRVLTAAGTN